MLAFDASSGIIATTDHYDDALTFFALNIPPQKSFIWR